MKSLFETLPEKRLTLLVKTDNKCNQNLRILLYNEDPCRLKTTSSKIVNKIENNVLLKLSVKR